MKKGKGIYIDGYNKLPDGRRVWLVQAADDAGWNWDEMLPHPKREGSYGWGGRDWIRSSSSRKRIRDEFRPGDIAVCYQAIPEKKVVGLARIASEGYAIRRGKRIPGDYHFDFDWGCWVEPVSLDVIKRDPLLRKTEKARVGQGTVFRVSADELDAILKKTVPVEESIATVEKVLNIKWPDSREPTANDEEFERRVRALLRSGPILEPAGAERPAAVIRTGVTVYLRDPAVRCWVLQQANGRCELCGCEAPFEDVNGVPFLETHHVRRLVDSGSDRTSNVVALCPNCHRHLHLGGDSKTQVTKLMSQVKRLVAE